MSGLPQTDSFVTIDREVLESIEQEWLCQENYQAFHDQERDDSCSPLCDGHCFACPKGLRRSGEL